VEFSLALIPFLLLLMAIVDLGRAIYMSNGVTQAAREIARVTSVHVCDSSLCLLGNSSQTQAVVAIQKNLVPNLGGGGSITFACTNVADEIEADTACDSGHYVRVTVSVAYTALTPILSMVAPQTLVSTAHVQVP
jgi:hypothetical protein